MSTQYDLNGKTVIITGANSGIGYAAAVQYAQCGAQVIIAARSAERGAAALARARAESGSENIDLMLVDMASQQSVRAFAAAALDRYPRLDLLINNAANFVFYKAPELTSEGYETIWATNHLGPFLLTHLLLGRLQASGAGRVINVSSQGLITFPNLKIWWDDLNMQQQKYSPQRAYYHSKLAQVMATRALARRLAGSGSTANCIRVTAVRFSEDRLEGYSALARFVYQLKSKAAITPAQMAEVYLWAGADAEAAAINGGHIDEKRRLVGAPRYADDVEAQERLWQVSLEQTGLAEAQQA